MVNGSTLSILGARPADTGKYTCVASNAAGEEDRIFHVNVYGEREACSLPGPAFAVCSWGTVQKREKSFLGFEVLTCIPSYSFSLFSLPPSSLCLLSLPLFSSLPLLPLSFSLPFLLLSPLSISLPLPNPLFPSLSPFFSLLLSLCYPVPPAIRGNKEEAEKRATLLHTSINIECRATGTPAPQINWLKNGLPLPLSPHLRLLSGGQVLRSAMCRGPMQEGFSD